METVSLKLAKRLVNRARVEELENMLPVVTDEFAIEYIKDRIKTLKQEISDDIHQPYS